jgi:hypothetical protein
MAPDLRELLTRLLWRHELVINVALLDALGGKIPVVVIECFD